jgi:hypothetical protein
LTLKLPILLIVAAAITAIVCGCGGGGGGSTVASGSTAASEKTGEEAPAGGAAPSAQLAKQANVICKGVKEGLTEDIEAYERQHEGEGEAVAGELTANAIVAALVPRLEKEIEEIGALSAKSGEEAEVAPFFEALESGIASSQESPSLEKIAKDFESADGLAKEDGFKSCLI